MKHWKILLLSVLIALTLGCFFHNYLNEPLVDQHHNAVPSATDAKADKDRKTAEFQELARIFAGCGPENRGPFDGRLLYKCVYNYALRKEFSLGDIKEQQKFKSWEHKHDSDGVLATKDQAIRAIVEMVASIGQVHTDFFDETEMARWRNKLDATITGIGAFVVQKGLESRLKALGDNPSEQQLQAAVSISPESPAFFWPAPIEGAPAAVAGIKAGDRIVMVGGKPVDGLTLAEVSKAMQGGNGSSIEIVVERNTGQGTVEVPLLVSRGNVSVPLITTRNLDGGNAPANIALLQLRAFMSNDLDIRLGQTIYKLCTGLDLPLNEQKGIDFPVEYDADRDCKLKGLVLDFRDDGGGKLDYATLIPQLLIDHGPLVSRVERYGNQTVETKMVLEPQNLVTQVFVNGEFQSATAKDRYLRLLAANVPIVVLINQNSASASEMVAGLLQKWGAVIVGTPSFGKNVGQELIPLAFGTGFKMTTFKFKPGGEDLGAAVMPDVEIEQSIAYLDDPMTATDAQMEKALEVMRNLIASGSVKAARTDVLRQQHADRDAKRLERRATEVRE